MYLLNSFKTTALVGILGAVLLNGTSYAMESSEAEAAPAASLQRRQILPDIEQGVNLYRRSDYKGALPFFENAFKMLEEGVAAQGRGESVDIDFGGKVGKGTSIFHPNGTVEQEYYYDSETRSLQKGAANIADLAARCAEELQEFLLAAQFNQKGAQFHASSDYRAPAQIMYFAAAKNFAALGSYDEALAQTIAAATIAKEFYNSGFICLTSSIQQFSAKIAGELREAHAATAGAFEALSQDLKAYPAH